MSGNTLENLELVSSIFHNFETVLYILKRIKCNYIEIVQIWSSLFLGFLYVLENRSVTLLLNGVDQTKIPLGLSLYVKLYMTISTENL